MDDELTVHVQNHGNRVGSDFDGIGVHGLTVESDLGNARLRADTPPPRVFDPDTPSRWTSSFMRAVQLLARPCDFQREGSAELVRRRSQALFCSGGVPKRLPRSPKLPRFPGGEV